MGTGDRYEDGDCDGCGLCDGCEMERDYEAERNGDHHRACRCAECTTDDPPTRKELR